MRKSTQRRLDFMYEYCRKCNEIGRLLREYGKGKKPQDCLSIFDSKKARGGVWNFTDVPEKPYGIYGATTGIEIFQCADVEECREMLKNIFQWEPDAEGLKDASPAIW